MKLSFGMEDIGSSFGLWLGKVIGVFYGGVWFIFYEDQRVEVDFSREEWIYFFCDLFILEGVRGRVGEGQFRGLVSQWWCLRQFIYEMQGYDGGLGKIGGLQNRLDFLVIEQVGGGVGKEEENVREEFGFSVRGSEGWVII